MNLTIVRMGWQAIIIGGVTLAGSSSAVLAAAPAESDSPWIISASPSMRQFHRVSFDSASGLQGGSQGNFNGRSRGGPLDGYADRAYEDGFVNIDVFTQNDGRTWNWGYDNSAQVEGNSLNFRGLDSRQTITEISGTTGSWTDSDEMEAGVRLSAERALWQKDKLSAGMVCGLDYARVNTGNSIQGTWTRLHQDKVVVDSYNLGPITPPAAPYEGDFFGPGPLINNIPTSRAIEDATHVDATDTVLISDSLDADVFTLSLGVTLRGEFGRVRIGAEAGPSVSVVPLTADHVETCVGAGWNIDETESDTSLQPGLFGQADVDVALYKNIGLRISGRYDWIDEIDGDIGPSRYSVDISGFSLSCGIYADL